jgi:SpoVK/Ycf46/Vps4 family AAA+-type ATPase
MDSKNSGDTIGKSRRGRRSRLTRNDDEKGILHYSAPTLVVIPKRDDTNGSIVQHFLCQWIGSSSDNVWSDVSNEDEWLLAYDDSVQIYPTTNGEDFQKILDAWQKDVNNPMVISQASSSHCRLCRQGNSEKTANHLHVWIRNRRNKNNVVSLSPLEIVPLQPASIQPLQSLQISLSHPAAAFQRYNDDTLSLLLSCWKRQLVGKVILRNTAVSCRLQFSHPQTASKQYYGEVTSFSAMRVMGSQQRYSSPSSLDGFYKIMPSTRITITMNVEKDDNQRQKITASAKSPSPAATTLAETIHCIQQGCHSVPRTFLLSGPPGTGKTYSVTWTWQQHSDNVHLCSLRGSELLQSTRPALALQREFEKLAAKTHNNNNDNFVQSRAVGILFLDECDALVAGGEGTSVSDMLAHLLDGVAHRWSNLIVVGATNRVDSFPAHVRRRFDVEIPMAPPNVQERAAILQRLLETLSPSRVGTATALPITTQVVQYIAESCVGFVPADLAALVRQAWLLSLQEQSEAITVQHLKTAQKSVGSSALRDAAIPPATRWDDIAGDPGGAKTALRQAIEWPRTKAKQFQALGLTPPRGILLYGPPGCAKTTLARAAAGASGIAFLSLSPAQVYASSYVGEAEAVIRRAFTLARSAAPCILFLDEIDSIFDTGSGGGGRGSSAEARVLSTFLNEMDGVDIAGNDGVLVLGATNRPWTLDSALLRPGRLGDKIIYLPPPDAEARLAILKMQFEFLLNEVENWNERDTNWDGMVELSDGMTGAELVGACQEAKMHWMRDGDSSREPFDYVLKALNGVKPLLSDPLALEPFSIFARGKQGTL